MTSRVVVTGATGFVGRHVLSPLQAAGLEVHSMGRGKPETELPLAHHTVDLLDQNAVHRCLAGLKASHLMHLAWYAEPGLYWHSPLNLLWVGASLALLKSFAENEGRRAVMIGTCAEYSWGGTSVLDEATGIIAPGTLYGTAKDAVRRVALAYAERDSLSVAWARLFYLYGPHEKRGRLISDAIVHLLTGQPFPTSAGTQQRDFMHIEDAAAALVALLRSDVRGCVNIGSGLASPVRQMLEVIADETKGEHLVRFGERSMSANEPALVAASVSRLRQEVGFSPKYDMVGGLRHTVNWWREYLGSPTN